MNTLSRAKVGQSGFTLLEIMMILAIIGILSAVAVPKYRSMTDYYHLRSSVQTVTSFIQYAKQRALDEHIVNHVGITKATKDPPNNVQVLHTDALLLVQSKPLDAGVTVERGINNEDPGYGIFYVSFNNRGYLVQGTASFILRGSSNRSVVINVDLLGNVTTVWD